MFYKGKKCDTRLYLLPAVGKKKPKETLLQGFVEA